MRADSHERPLRRVFGRLRLLPDAVVVVWWLGVAELGVRLVTLPRVARLMGAPLAVDEVLDSPRRLSVRPVERRRLQLVETLGARWPFCAGPCLRQALVAGHVLRRWHPRLRIGARLDSTAIAAHAWVEVAGQSVGNQGGFVPLSAPAGERT